MGRFCRRGLVVCLLIALVRLAGGNAGISEAVGSSTSPQSQAGELDRTFGQDGIVTTHVSTGLDEGRDIAVQPDGKVVLGGFADGYLQGFMVARYDQLGVLDPTFGEAGTVMTMFGLFSGGEGLALQDDGRIVVAGFTGTDGNNDIAVVRYLADGSLDASFGGDGIVTTGIGLNDETASAVAIQADGKIVVVGATIGRSSRFVVARYLADGTLDATFGSGGIVSTPIGTDATANDVILQPDGKIVAVGTSTSNVTGKDFAIVRYGTDGTPDATFGGDGIVTIPIAPGNGDDTALGVTLQPDGRIVTVGYTPQPADAFAVVRLNSDASLDSSFDGDGIVITGIEGNGAQATDVVIQSDGRIVVSGSSLAPAEFAVARYQTDGALDETFGTGGMATTAIGDQAYALGVAIGTDGNIVLGGTSYTNGNFVVAAARYLAEGLIGAALTISAVPDHVGLGDPVDLSGSLSFDDGASVAGKTVHITRTNPDGSATSLPDVVTDALGGFSASDTPVAIGSSVYSGRFDGDQTHDPATASDGVTVSSTATSDFNGDGTSDLAVGVPWEDSSGVTDTGAISAIYGATTGLASVNNQFWDENGTGSTSNGYLDGFGYASASGDFNGDGTADLAASIPGKTVGGATYAGAVTILYGSLSGLTKTGSQLWSQDSADILDQAEANDFFGWSLAAGDLNGDGYADLTVGVPGESTGTKTSAGGVNVLYGSSTGLTSAGNQFWSQDSGSIEGKAEVDDEFGLSVAAGDFNGDGYGDLVAGAPLEDLSTSADAGAVNVIYGSAAGLTSTDDQLWDQDSSGINNSVEKADLFGYSVAVGDFDGDGYGDLIAGVPLEDLSGGTDGGAANVIYGTSSGLSSTGDQFWNQDKDGINDLVEKGDNFGAALTAGDFDGDGYDDAVFGIAGEDVGSVVDSGAVSVIYGTSGGLDDANDDYWRQNSTGIEDSSETNDLFGYSVVAGNFGNGPEDDLAIGVPLEGVSVSFQGAVNVIYGSPSDLTSTNDQFWNQDSTDILDQGEYDDEFGFGLDEPGAGGAAPSRGNHLRFARRQVMFAAGVETPARTPRPS